MERPEAEILALKALSWAATLEGALLQFAAHTGIETANLRQRAGEPELLAALLDFLLSNDALAMAFCEEAGIESRQLHNARRLLPGGRAD